MLNAANERELCYVVKIDEVRDIEGVNNQVAVVNGWTIFVRRDQFKAGDLAIYFEIDSKVPETEEFAFLEKYKYRVKTQKFVRGLVISQGLLMHPEDFGWSVYGDYTPVYSQDDYIKTPKGEIFRCGDFLTKRLGVTYYEAEDNARKAPSVDKYKRMMQRHPKLVKNRLAKWLMKRNWGKKLLFVFFGKKKDKKNSWPDWVQKTDEERVQNLPHLFPANDQLWIATEKIDGSSSTYTMKQGRRNKREIKVCSRNVCFDKADAKCFYDINIYTEMAEKYDIERLLNCILDEHPNWEYITLQGETYGEGIQKRTYNKEHRLAIFNVIYKENGKAPVRLNPVEMHEFIYSYNIRHGFYVPCVPIVNTEFKLPATCEELLAMAGGASKIDGGMREGLVFRSYDGKDSFKAVDNQFLLKYHG